MRVAMTAIVAAFFVCIASAIMPGEGNSFSVVVAADQIQETGHTTAAEASTSEGAAKKAALEARQDSCDCPEGYCCLEDSGEPRCIELDASICPSPFGTSTAARPTGTGKVVTFPIATRTAPAKGNGEPGITTTVHDTTTVGSLYMSTLAPVDSITAAPVARTGTGATCDESCCFFSPSWYACVGGYLTTSGEQLSQPKSAPALSQQPVAVSTTGTLDMPALQTSVPRRSSTAAHNTATFILSPPMTFVDGSSETNNERLGVSTATSNIETLSTLHKSVSQNGTCGAFFGTTCEGSGFGDCCGGDNTCGSDTDHCAMRSCNPGSLYGLCWSSDSSPSSSAAMAATSTSAMSVVSPTTGAWNVSIDGSCGSENGQTCKTSNFGSCCSIHGWCGHTDAYCAPANCDRTQQWGFCEDLPGNLSGRADSAELAEIKDLSNSIDIPRQCGILGPDAADYGTCFDSGNCCSVYGFCGSGREYCSAANCDPNWGYCDGERAADGAESLAQNSTFEPDSLHHARDAIPVAQTTVYKTTTASGASVNATDTSRTSSETLGSNSTLLTAYGDAIVYTTVGTILTQTVTAGAGNENVAPNQTSSAIHNNVTLTDPINTAITTVVPGHSTRWIINNTSIDTNVYLNISTFSATGLTVVSSGTLVVLMTGETIESPETVKSTKISLYSPKETAPFNGGPQQFSPSATTDVDGHNHSSAGMKAMEISGSRLAMLAGMGVAGVFGLMLLL